MTGSTTSLITLNDIAQRDEETCECPMCHCEVRTAETMAFGGRRLCFGCGSGWYEEDEDAND